MNAPVSARKANAVEAAMELFWRKGFAETSMADMVAATGMNRYALYSSFGSKREIFFAAMEAYFEEGRQTFEPILRDPETAPLDRIENSLRVYSKMMHEQENGCFICHVAAEQCADDPKIAEVVALYFAKIKEFIEIPLKEAAVSGDLNPQLSPKAAAQLVFNAEMSMGAHMRAGVDGEIFELIISATMAALKAP